VLQGRVTTSTHVASPLEDVVLKIVFSYVLPKAGLTRHHGWQEVEWRDFSASTMMGLGGVVQQAPASTCDDERAQGRGTVWRRGGIDGRPGEAFTLI
jgi:hypothetical protein